MSKTSSHEVQNFWRPAYEAIAAVVWFIGALVYLGIGRRFDGLIAYSGLLAIPMTGMALYRLGQAVRIWNFKCRLWSPSPIFSTVQRVLSKQKKRRALWLGWGFTWEPLHAKRLRVISSLDEEQTKPPPSYLRLRQWLNLSVPNHTTDGYHYVHGVGDREDDVFVDYESLRGHTYIVGTTGAGKTRTFEILIAQAVARGGPVLVLDPKGDLDLRDRCHAEALRHGRQADFRFFSPTLPQFSMRLNPLQNYARSSQIANRIASLLPRGGTSTAFRDFAWRAINVVVDGLLQSGSDPNLMNLRRYVEGDIDGLIVKAVERYLTDIAFREPRVRGWQSEVRTLVGNLKQGGSVSLDRDTSLRAVALATYYTQTVKPGYPDKTIDAMLSIMLHDRAHYSKLISNLIPLLEQLTSGPMQQLLSPNCDDPADVRTIENFQKLIDKNSIVYINLDTLADSIVGSAVGSLFLADLTSVAAARYASEQTNLPPVSVFVDEAAEMINDAFIQNLNKGRGAGFELYIASQTIADFVAKMGDAAMAMQALGNTNTTIALRIKDPDTRKFASTLFGETHFAETSTGHSASTIHPAENLDFGGTVSKTQQRKDLAIVSEDALGKLPNLHYFASLPGGKRIKGRIPILPISPEERYRPSLPRAIPIAEPLTEPAEASSTTPTVSPAAAQPAYTWTGSE
jgi:conjugal transfer pilus assembly protein TraD